jgi:hypothetical protein
MLANRKPLIACVILTLISTVSCTKDNTADNPKTETSTTVDSNSAPDISGKIKSDSTFQNKLSELLVDSYFETEDFRPPSSFNLVVTKRSREKMVQHVVDNGIKQLYDEDMERVVEFYRLITGPNKPATAKLLNDAMESNKSVSWLTTIVKAAHMTHCMN